MLLHWKFLLMLGAVLWFALCLSDYFFSKDINYNTYICDITPVEADNIQEELNWFTELLRQYIDSTIYTFIFEDYYNISLVLWIVLTFFCATIIYFTCRFIFKLIAKNQNLLKGPSTVQALDLKLPQTKTISDLSHEPVLLVEAASLILDPVSNHSDTSLKKSNSISKIPILVTRHEAQAPINIKEEGSPKIIVNSSTPCNEDINKSCPNLSPKTSHSKNKILLSLYEHNVNTIKSSKSVDRLRDEIVMLQATSFREQAILSRKLDAIVKEKRDLSIALVNSLKENKTAKRQLEEIQKERSVLIKQLESATIEIKSNTKSKRLTLTRLEKAIEDSKKMKSEFTRLTAGKQILEERVVLLNRECKEMKERRNILNKSYSEIKHNYDGDSIKTDKTDEDSLTSGGYYEVTDKQLYQSNIDMNKVQIKLNDLEKSLEKLKFSSTITKEHERSTQEECIDNILSDELCIINGSNYGTIDDCKMIEEDDEDDTTESQNPNYDYAAATAVTSVSSLDIDDCQSLCLLPGCGREHSICDNPVCVYEHAVQDEDTSRKGHHNPEKNLNSVTSTNQIILEAVKEKSAVLAKRSSLFDTSEARARLAAFFSVSLWKKDPCDHSTIQTMSDDKLSIESESQKTEFDYEEWSPRLVPPGIVSQSPAFQNFLSNVILDQRNAIMEQKNLRSG